MKLTTACILVGITLGYVLHRVDEHGREVRLALHMAREHGTIMCKREAGRECMDPMGYCKHAGDCLASK